ncbi:phosphotransferase family protein [Streptomyces sp. NPDC055992]|uniref:phosphotransferase family protein n=1 Tax=Streptomyces sp. NPDC055992 TaxID=3345673 RepID=UPI0035D8D2F5
MTTTVDSESAARQACEDLGLLDGPMLRLHEHATSVYLLSNRDVVVRVSSASQEGSLATAVALTRWLTARGFPATNPLDAPQPVVVQGCAVTFWDHYPQPDTAKAAAGDLGLILNTLHKLELPPMRLPEYRPLASLQTVLAESPRLRPEDREWLQVHCYELLRSYGQLTFPLGIGLIHGDAYPGNTLWDGSKLRLGDWDEAAIGPREVDLANTFQGVRFGRTEKELDEFSANYQYDIRQWPGLPVLCRIRDLHTLGSYIRRAEFGDEAALRQMTYRIETLKNQDDRAQWSAA